MTLNHKDVPRELYKRVGFISYDVGEFRNIGVYRFMADKFERMIKSATDWAMFDFAWRKRSERIFRRRRRQGIHMSLLAQIMWRE